MKAFRVHVELSPGTTEVHCRNGHVDSRAKGKDLTSCHVSNCSGQVRRLHKQYRSRHHCCHTRLCGPMESSGQLRSHMYQPAWLIRRPAEAHHLS